MCNFHSKKKKKGKGVPFVQESQQRNGRKDYQQPCPPSFKIPGVPFSFSSNLLDITIHSKSLGIHWLPLSSPSIGANSSPGDSNIPHPRPIESESLEKNQVFHLLNIPLDDYIVHPTLRVAASFEWGFWNFSVHMFTRNSVKLQMLIQ